MIRGAGDILGPEQAGFIDSVGLDLYLKMLNEVMEEKKNGVVHEPPKPVKLLQLNAYIPGEYASKEDKIQLYQQIENAKNVVELKQIKKNVRDIYGKLPDEVNLLFKKREIDILLSHESFDKITELYGNLEIVLSKKFSSISGIGAPLFEALEPLLDVVTVSYLQKTLRIKLKKEGNYLLTLETLAHVVIDLYNRYSSNKA